MYLLLEYRADICTKAGLRSCADQYTVLPCSTICCALLQMSAMGQRPKGWEKLLDEKA